MSKCEYLGHSWQSTTVPGWLQCKRVIRYSGKGVATRCNMPAVCPGCLGYRLEGVINRLCAVHDQTCVLDDFPVSTPEADGLVSGVERSNQLPLW